MPAAHADISDYTWVANGLEITITGYSSDSSNVVAVIPNSIDGLPVTSIGGGAFAGCSALTGVTIPDSVASIGKYAFGQCTALTSITLGNSVTSIGDRAFGDCDALTSITVTAGNPVYTDLNGVLFNADQTTIVVYPAGLAGSYAIPSSVTSIGDRAFWECTALTSVIVPDSVTRIGEQAFGQSTALSSATIGNGVTSIGRSAFGGCSSLTSITLGNSVTSIGSRALGDCDALTSITVTPGNPVYTDLNGVLFNADQSTIVIYPAGLAGSYAIPGSVTSIGDKAFRDCTALTSVIIPDRVTSIGDHAFWNCTALTSITLGNSVTGIGDKAFSSCSSLASITFPTSVTSIEDHAFWKCTALTSLIIPASVTSIGDGAFSSCSSLASVTLPASVTSIGDGAFDFCRALTSVYIVADELTIDPAVFAPSRPTIYYLAGTLGWDEAYWGRPTALWTLPELTEILAPDSTRNPLIPYPTGTTNVVDVMQACMKLGSPAWDDLWPVTWAGRVNTHLDSAQECRANLREIFPMIDQYAIEWCALSGDVVDLRNFAMYLERGASTLMCPGGGDYAPIVVNERPSCSLKAHVLK